MGAWRSVSPIVMAIVLAAAGAAAQGTTRDVATLRPFVGVWAVQGRDLRVGTWIELELRGGELEGVFGSGRPLDVGSAVALVALEGTRIELAIEDQGDGPGRLVIERAADGGALRVIECTMPGSRVAPVSLPRRDALWSAMQSDLGDMAHDADGEGYSLDQMRFFAASVDAARLGLADADAITLADQPNDALCVLDLASSTVPRGCRPARPATCAAALAETRALAAALARARGTRSICDVDRSTVAAAAPPADACARVVVQDADGRTTVRAGPSSRSAAAGTIASGTTIAVEERRGRWVRVGGAVRGWLYDANVRCAPPQR